jgi:hypothetical protein
MRRRLGRLLGGVALLLVVAGGLWGGRDPILRRLAERRLRAMTGLQASIGRFTTRPGTAGVTLRDFKLFNPAEYGGAPLVDIPHLHFELDRESALAGRLRFNHLQLNVAQVEIVRGTNGRLNTELLQEWPARRGKDPHSKRDEPRFRMEFAGIERLELSLGRVSYTDLLHTNQTRQFDIRVANESATDLATLDDVNNWLWTLALRVVLRELWGGGAETEPHAVVESKQPAPHAQ